MSGLKGKTVDASLVPGELQLDEFSTSGFGVETDFTRQTQVKAVLTNFRLIVSSRSWLFCFIPYDTEVSLLTREVVDIVISNSKAGWLLTIITTGTIVGAPTLIGGAATDNVVAIVIGVLFLVAALIALILYIIKLVKRDMDVVIDVCKDKTVVASWAGPFAKKQPRGKSCIVTLPSSEAYRLLHAILRHPETQLLPTLPGVPMVPGATTVAVTAV